MNINFDDVNLTIDGKSILSRINLGACSNQFVGIVGGNGAGKSSLLRCIYKPSMMDSGTITIGDKDITQMDVKEVAQTIGAVLQEMPTDFGLSVLDIVMMGRTPHQKLFSSTTRSDLDFVKYALKKVRMLDFINEPFSTLSGGEKQRVLIARVFAQTPQTLILDEPTNHLDIHHQINIMKLAKDLKITTLAVVHDLNLAAAFCDFVYIMKDGKIFDAGQPHVVLNAKNIKKAFGVDVNVTICTKDKHPRLTIQYL